MPEVNEPPFHDPEALREWLRRVLMGVELTIATDDRPYRAVARLMRQGPSSHRPLLLEVASDLLDELYCTPSSWSVDAAGQLLALAGVIFADTSREGAVALQLAQFVREALHKNVPRDTILSAGSALLGLRRHEAPAFWRAVAARVGETSLPLVFEGIGRSAWDSLLNWLPDALKLPRAEQSLINLLPYFASIRTGEELLRLSDRVGRLLSKERQAELKAFLLRAGIEQSGPVARSHVREKALPRDKPRHGGAQVNVRINRRARPLAKLRATTPFVAIGSSSRFRAERASLQQYEGQRVNDLIRDLILR